MLLRIVMVCGMALCVSNARAANANDYAIFGGNSLTFAGYAWVKGGPVGSNGDVTIQGASATFDEIRGGGVFNRDPAAWGRPQVSGNMIFNGDVRIPALSNIAGSVHSGGKFYTEGDIGGNVVAAGDATIWSDVTGSVTSGGNALMKMPSSAASLSANGNVILDAFATVTGAVIHGGTFTKHSAATVGSESVGSVTANPQKYEAAVLPPATVFTSGGTNYSLGTFGDLTLAPGSYGSIQMGGSTKLRLTGGNYYFDSLTATGTFQSLYLDLTHGPINIFVSGNTSFQRVTPYINGVVYNDASVDPNLAADVLLESHGNIFLSGRFFGSLFAPTTDITTDTIGTVIGSIVGGNNVVIGSSTSVSDYNNYVPSVYLAAAVPEPSVLGLVMGGAMIWLGRRRR